MSDKVEESKKKLSQLNSDIKQLQEQRCNLQVVTEPREEQNPSANPFLDFIGVQIEEKEKELECPVCLETAAPPIFMCEEQHLVCESCRPKVRPLTPLIGWSSLNFYHPAGGPVPRVSGGLPAAEEAPLRWEDCRGARRAPGC